MKKLFLLIAFVLLLAPILLTNKTVEAKKTMCTDIKSGSIIGSDGDVVEMGYNDWGYNYNAHMFNGDWCDYHPVYRSGGANHDWCLENMSDVELMMKWSDTWLSNQDCNNDTKLDRGYSCDPENAGSSACPGAWLTNHEKGTYKSMIDEYILSFSLGASEYVHDMVVDTHEDGLFEGTGGYPSSLTYSHTWTVDGELSGDNVSFHIEYLTGNPGYTVDAVGVVAEDGTMSGTWSSSASQTGTWASTAGAIQTCEYNVFTKMVTPNKDIGDYEDSGYWYNVDGEEIGEVIWGAYAITQVVEKNTCEETHGLNYKSEVSPGLGYYTPKP